MKGKWTEIFTRREKDIPGHLEKTDGIDHGQGWACTCGCNERLPHRKHSEGAPKDMCVDGYVYGHPAEMFVTCFQMVTCNLS